MANNNENNSTSEEIKELLLKNSESIEEIKKQVKFIYSYIFWQRIWRIIKVLVIIAIFVIGLIYLPPLIQNFIAPYQELIQELGGQQKNLFETLQKLPGAEMFLNNPNIINAK
ncbi:MAG: hypothetical protein Athens101410_83 [Parcubacteria group bacterium Athens1014_10]|nr:MAG: hypothetical protein Athens101410_83 [Parcubacteria group bacterium Athens1014_10]TSD06109.1 MAG: hypothetical protein Athens071412_83 [Parcubacteria group bacterium Athens0714_12]